MFRTDAGIGTFEFAKALRDGFESHYDLAKERFTTWLNDWLAPYENKIPIYDTRFIRPIISNSVLPPAIIRHIDDDLTASPCIKGKRHLCLMLRYSIKMENLQTDI